MTVTARSAATLDHIGHIVGLRPEREMGWIHARLHVATVTHDKPSREFTSVQGVGEPMRWHCCAMPNAEVSVPVPVLRASPEPALVSGATIDLEPKAENGVDGNDTASDLCNRGLA
jgi:hypothetical protein